MLRQASFTPPSYTLMMMEARALPEFIGFLGSMSLFTSFPHGDGHPVLVLPGMLGNDASTLALRSFLKGRGYEVHGWEQGRNRGLRAGVEDRMLERVRSIVERSGRKVSLVGWSLGGIYARMIAKLMPDHVRSVITLGSPFAGAPQSTNAWHVYEAVSGQKADAIENHPAGRLDVPLAMPATSIFSRTDGVCAWQSCVTDVGPLAENIEVEASHCGMGAHPAVLFAIADRLAQKEGDWKPFHRSGCRSLFFPDSERTDALHNQTFGGIALAAWACGTPGP